jgi:hypothetical protein
MRLGRLCVESPKPLSEPLFGRSVVLASLCLRLGEIVTRTFARDDNVETNSSKFGKASTIAW